MPADSNPTARRGAYGLAVDGLDGERDLLVPAAANWPSVTISIDTPAPEDRTTLLTDSLARYPDGTGGHVFVGRTSGTAHFGGPRPLTSDEIVHPRLGMLSALYAHWLHRAAFHAGAFVNSGRAWALVGDRGDGKSTLMAALALRGLTVLGDDTLVLDGVQCLCGVRCIDLRPDAVARLGCGEQVSAVRRGVRRRLPLGAAPTETPLAGWLFLAWADELSLRALSVAELLRRIARPQGWHRRGAGDQALLLELAALPAWELRRPRDGALLAQTVERVCDLTSR